MEIEFLKMQGCGDDSILLNAARLPPLAGSRLPGIARRMLDRGFGVGGNALLVLGRAESGALHVRSFDAGGEESGLTCHAARCAARYAADSGASDPSAFVMETAGGAVRVQIIDSSNVRVDMGVPMASERGAVIRETPIESFVRSILVGGKSLSYTPISLGRSYAMIFVPDFSFPVARTARRIAEQPDFPALTGIGFVQVYSRDEIRLRAWEGEAGAEADECGCAAAAVVASVVNGFTDREVFVHLRGGDVFLQWEEADNRLWLTGPASYVFTGTYDYEEPSKE
ncbi:MAG TPA: diaminopimelate epimerase [Spirochaetia bacterium]|nr:diaminopimelate epimerase [Spirochaetia bacterium]